MNIQALLREAFDNRIDDLPPRVFRDPPRRLKGGNETSIYAFNFDVVADHPFYGPLIVRIFDKATTDPKQYLWEQAAHAVLADEGFPVPRILLASDQPGLGGSWLIMERIPGAMLGGNALEMPWGIFRFAAIYASVPKLMAELHQSLHAINPQKMESALAALPVDTATFSPAGRLEHACARIPESWTAERRTGDILLAQQPPIRYPVICHGDFHPLNVMVDGATVTGVLDWSRICLADAEYDLAAADLLLRASAVNLPQWVTPLVDALKRGMADRFIKASAAHQAIDRDQLRFYRAQRAFEELLLRKTGATPEMGQVAGWNLPLLASIVNEQSGMQIC